MTIEQLKTEIENIWQDRTLLSRPESVDTIEQVISLLESGNLRVAQPDGETWKVNEWVKQAVILYFPIRKMETTHAGPMEFYDKMALKSDYAKV